MVTPENILASLAETGIFDVLAINTILSIRGRPLFGSIIFKNSFNASAISFPLSPQPTNTIISASDHFAKDC
jgi:hypothetical protein